MADAAALIKHTGRFYDLYSETHRATPPPAGDGESSWILPGNLGTGEGGSFCRNCGAAPGVAVVSTPGAHKAGTFPKAGFPQGRRQSVGAGGGGSPIYPGSGSFSRTGTATASAGSQAWGGGGEKSGNFLGRTVEHWAEAAAATAGGAAATKELDRRCYSLLESNAQLCLKLQGLGLEYAGLTRVLLAAGEEVRGARQVLAGPVGAVERFDAHPKGT